MSKQRTYAFTETERQGAFTRQEQRCAMCGLVLGSLIPSDNCHHVIPNQAGEGRALPPATADFLRSVDNAVVLCQGCHVPVAHGGNTRTGAMPFFGQYRFSHGRAMPPEHDAWLARLREHAAAVWGQPYRDFLESSSGRLDRRLGPADASRTKAEIMAAKRHAGVFDEF